MKIPLIFYSVLIAVGALIIGSNNVGNIGDQITKVLDLDKKRVAIKIQRAIDNGDYEKANELYVKTQDNPPLIGSTAYNNLGDVREQIEYYRKYRASLDIFNSNNPQKDWDSIINNLANMPPNFGYVEDVTKMLAEAKKNKEPPKQEVAGTQTKKVFTNTTVSNKIDCIGPDGKHLRITQKECDDFNNAWKNNKANTSSFSCEIISGQFIKTKDDKDCELARTTFKQQVIDNPNYQQQNLSQNLILENAKIEAKRAAAQSCLQLSLAKADSCSKSCRETYNQEYAICNFGRDNQVWETDRYNECLNEIDIKDNSCTSKCNNDFISEQNQCIEEQKK